MESINQKILMDIRQMIYKKLGIHISEDKQYILESKLVRLITKENLQSLDQFHDSLKNGDLRQFENLVKYITTNHTFFFREKDHLGFLVDLIRKKNMKRPMIWCNACSTGEEVYSIIIELIEKGIFNFFVVASDINKEVLHQLNNGIYHINKLQFVSEKIKKKYFIQIDSENFKIKDILRKYFSIKKINLLDRVSFDDCFDYIFCRNVLIYFNAETRQRAVDNLVLNLRPQGYLFLGHTETLSNLKIEINRVYNSVYQKTG